MKTSPLVSLPLCAFFFAQLAAPVHADLVAYYPLDGDFIDASGNGNDGTFLGGTEYVASVPDQLGSGMAVEFDGSAGTYGSINDGEGGLALTKSPSHSVSMWVRGDGTAQNDDRVFSEGMTTDNNPLFNVGTKNDGADGTVDFFFRNGGSPGHLFSSAEAFDGDWHHLAWVDNGGLVDLYIDGELDTQFDYVDFNDDNFAPDTTTIGGILRGTDCCNFLGSIDDVGMWDDPLTAEEIAKLAAGASPLTLRGGGLVSYWNFDDDSVADAVGENDADEIVAAGFNADTPNGSGKSLDLSGDDYVKLPDTDFGIGETNTFTISAWLKMTSSERGAVSIVHDLTSGGGDRSGITLGAGADGAAFVGIIASTGDADGDAANSGPTFRDITTDLIVPVGEWAHLAATLDVEDRLTVYVNGAAAQTYTVTPADSIDADGGNVTGGTGIDFIDTDGSFTGFGASGNGPEHADSLGDFTRLFYDGLLDEVAIWNVALDAAGVQMLKDGTHPAEVPLPVPDTDFDDDGLPNSYEERFAFLDPNNAADAALDEDGDTVSNLDEFENNTAPDKKDTDEDGLDDNVETNTGTFVDAGNTGTDPLEPDTDEDGLADGVETGTGNFVDATNTGTSPLATDTDGDGHSDSSELRLETDPTDPASKPSPTLLAYWPLETIADDKTPDESGNGLDLDAVNMTEDNVVEGRVGNAFLFSRFDETMLTYVAAEEGGDLLPVTQYEQYTISLWVNADFNEQEAADLRVFSEGSTTSNDPLLNIGTHNTNADATVDIFLRNAGGPGHQHSVGEAFDGEWHHIAYVREGDLISLYIDGQLDDTDWDFRDTYVPEVTNTTTVGGILRGGPSHWIDGMIDEVSLWGGALPAADIAELASGNPIGGGSIFQIIGIDLAGGNVTLTWTSRQGKTYSVEQAEDLSIWQELDDGVESGGDETSFTIPLPEGAAQYFRVREQ